MYDFVWLEYIVFPLKTSITNVKIEKMIPNLNKRLSVFFTMRILLVVQLILYN